MSAIALTLAEMGHDVSGSDLRELPVLDRLRAAGVTVHVGHDRDHVKGVDAVTASTAIPAGNVELVAAAEDGVTVLRRAGMLAAICAQADALAVAGTHGKTTTTSMLAMILAEAGLDPSFVVGGDLHEVGTGAHWSGGQWLVVEADESDGTHLELPLAGTILTNVEADHLDHYGTFDAIVDGLRPLPGPGRRAQGPLRRRPGDGGPRRPPRRHHLRHRRRCPLPGPGHRHRRGSPALRRRPRRHRARRGGRPAAGPAQRAQRPRRDRDGRCRRRAVRGHGAGAGPLRRRRPPLRRAGSPRGHHPRRRLRAPPRRDRGRARRRGRQRRRLDPLRRRLPAQPLQPHGRAVAGVRRRVRRRRRGRHHRHLPVRPGADPRRHREAGGRRGAATPTRSSGSCGCPQRADLVAFLVGELRPGDVCISMGCGDVAELPDEVLAGLVRKVRS